METRKLNHFYKEITSVYDDGKLDVNDFQSLDKLKNNITDAYSKGKINNDHYIRLNNEISICMKKYLGKKLIQIP
jgi:alpha-D-ribose 1-methylphosphonate 5-triphosphate diphosphatase PhnM